MKNILFTSVFLIGLSCQQNKKVLPPDITTSQNDEPSYYHSVQEKVLDREYKITRVISDGITTYDTIFLDSIVEKILPESTVRIGDSQYLLFSKFAIEEPMKFELSYYPSTQYISRIDTSIVLKFEDVLIEKNSIEFINSPLELGDCCGGDCSDALLFDFKKAQSLDPSNYIYLITTVYEELSKHILVKDNNGELVKLFEIESSNRYLRFDIKNDTILWTNYWSYTDEQDYVEKQFQYDLLNFEVLKDSVVP